MLPTPGRKCHDCPVCNAEAKYVAVFRVIDGIDFFECGSCGTLFADFAAVEAQRERRVTYDHRYWEDEVRASRSRSFGASIARCAELFLYARSPIESFLDIGSGPGFFLDAISALMPNYSNMFYAVELYPPPVAHRTSHANYIIGDLSMVPVKIGAGLCVEVIEHMWPNQLSTLLAQLARISAPEAIYLFNSGQPAYVKNEDPGYLDPFGRGHIVSYSVLGLRRIFAEHGFQVIALPGRDWAFLAEFSERRSDEGAEALLARIWHPDGSNADKLKNNGFGELMYAVGVESARCYLESALVEERTRWALSLQRQIDEARG